MNEIKIGFLEKSKGNKSSMRLYGFIAILCIAYIIIITGICMIVIVTKDNPDYQGMQLFLIGVATVITALATIILYKAVQSFPENKNGGQSE